MNLPEQKKSYWIVTAIFDPKFGLLKEDVIWMLKEKEIDLRPFFYPLSSQPAYAAFALARETRGGNGVAYRVSPYGVNLPWGMNILKRNVKFVVQSMDDLIKKIEFNHFSGESDI